VVVAGDDCDAEQIKDWCNARLGKQQRMADLIIIEDLPRNTNGKILKRELRNLYGDRVYD
jgi:acyl-CoA synthetase (AMP-forming)/AMP-acid ligase II